MVFLVHPTVILVLLAALVEGCFVYRMRDFFCMFDFLYHYNNWIFIEWTSLFLRVNIFSCRCYTVGLSWLIPSLVVFLRLFSCTCISLAIFLSPSSSE